MQQLSSTKGAHFAHKLNILTPTTADRIVAKYRHATSRLLMFDYDGVLSELVPDPRPAASAPTPELLDTLRALGSGESDTAMILSGRGKHALHDWFSELPLALGAEHGAWVKTGGRWSAKYNIAPTWKAPYREHIESVVRVTPGSRMEIKDYSLVWHYRSVEPQLAYEREMHLKRTLDKLAANTEIGVFQGHKIIEVKPRVISKGAVAQQILEQSSFDFILAIGDDYTDEDMFAALPSSATTIKVGEGSTGARYHIKTVAQVKNLLSRLAAVRASVDGITNTRFQ